jgi:hypothetical protein
MGLSTSEKKMLARLQQKSEEPDAPPIGKSLNISLDLGDEKQVERATKLGLLDRLFGDNDDDDDETEDENDDTDDEAPRRRGYFPKG